MGRMNGCKAACKRERAQAKLAGQTSAHSQLDSNKKAQTLQCKICMQTFLCTTSTTSLKEHSTNRHARNTFQECFPGHEE
ncbi:hypothetical protein PAPYR_1706 [Paratrimastix pyriformis]|uniref:At2g23090-like zinc-binding domain-containing protein n=1 Tax=Paratrimastix pyriformis TaxID=342808 RepID=A0ABQ8UT60_9EUKA|nr:hypothetical protein PAPYR_1706 [Paratrimastix pyriformis]